jgi:hypothetical protein
MFLSSMENHAMSDHQLKFKGAGFNFDAKGLWGLVAAIVSLLLLIPRLVY